MYSWTSTPRNRMSRYSGSFEVILKSQFFLCYIFNVNKVTCLDIQSFEIFSPSMSFPGPNTSFHTLRLIHHSKSISRLFRGGAKCSPSSVFHSTIIAQLHVRLLYTKRVKTCPWIIINERVTVPLISICI